MMFKPYACYETYPSSHQWQQLSYTRLLATICTVLAVYAKYTKIPEIDAALTAAAPWKVGEVIPNSQQKIYASDQVVVNCKFLGVTTEEAFGHTILISIPSLIKDKELV